MHPLLPDNLVEAMRLIYQDELDNKNAGRHGLPDRDLDRLSDEGFLQFRGIENGMGQYDNVLDLVLKAPGLRAIEVWPSPDDPVTALLNAITEAAERSDDPEERTKLQKLGSVASEVGKNTLAGVLAAYVASSLKLLGG